MSQRQTNVEKFWKNRTKDNFDKIENIIKKFLLIEHLPIIEDIQKAFQKASFELYLTSISDDLNMLMITCLHGYDTCCECEKNLDKRVVLNEFLRALCDDNIQAVVISALESCVVLGTKGYGGISLWARVNKGVIELSGNVCCMYDENIEVKVCVDYKGGDLPKQIDSFEFALWEIILTQSKFFRTFIKKFEGYDEARFKKEALDFVNEFSAL